jgi:Asp-tRNA(Asn)/Glu-tRNA(Gln) amidotransferase B subunit
LLFLKINLTNWIKKVCVIIDSPRINDGDYSIMIEVEVFGSQIGGNKGLKQVSDIGALEKIIKEVLKKADATQSLA